MTTPNMNLQTGKWLQPTNTSSCFEAALAYAKHGWRVFPAEGSQPLVDDFDIEATTDASRIHEWWSDHPKASVATVTGSGLAVVCQNLQLSPKSASSNHDAAAEMLPETLTAISAGDKKYLYYVTKSNLSSCDLGLGRTFKCEAGAVLIPPSVSPVTGKRLQWDSSVTREIVSLPRWVAPRVEQVQSQDTDSLCCGAESLTLVREESTPKQGSLVNAANVKPKDLSWLWSDRIPLGKLVILDGDPGLGKSTMTLDIAARITTGSAMPDGSHGDVKEPSAVLVISNEDDDADTIVPRFSEAKGNQKLLWLWDKSIEFRIPRDVDRLASLISENRIRLIIIDPLAAFLNDGLKIERDQDVRKALGPLSAMAGDTGCTVIAIRHLNKQASVTNSLYRGGGSIGITGAARVVLLVAPSPLSDDENETILSVAKNNLVPRAKSLTYRIESSGTVSKLSWTGESALLADDLLVARSQLPGVSATDTAKDFLLDELRDNDWHPISQVKLKAKSRGIAQDTLKRAKRELGVEHKSEGFGNQKIYYWQLPRN